MAEVGTHLLLPLFLDENPAPRNAMPACGEVGAGLQGRLQLRLLICELA